MVWESGGMRLLWRLWRVRLAGWSDLLRLVVLVRIHKEVGMVGRGARDAGPGMDMDIHMGRVSIRCTGMVLSWTGWRWRKIPLVGGRGSGLRDDDVLGLLFISAC